MSVSRYEAPEDRQPPGAADIQPDWLRLYRPNAQEVQPAEQGSEAVQIVRVVRDHSTLAREGLERVANLNPSVDVDKTHKMIRVGHQVQLKKLLDRVHPPHRPRR